MARIDFGGVIEEVVTSEEFPIEKARKTLAHETVAVLGYGVQGPAQSLNMRDNGIHVIVGQRKEERVFWKRQQNGEQSFRCSFPMRDRWPYGRILKGV
jgi:ketol-acid reductoisomerase